MERTREHVQFLDHLRGLAILAVFVFHALGAAFGMNQLRWGPWWRNFAAAPAFLALLPATYGWAGVAVFFVVSGFCIHLSHLRSSAGDWRGFYVRRFFRIYPPYFLAVVFFGVFFPFTRLPIAAGHGRGQMVSHLLLFNNLSAEADLGINPSFWSVAVEAQLYLIYPLLLALVGRIGWRRALIVLAALEILMRGYDGASWAWTGHSAPRWFDGSPFFYWFSWATGAALADAFAAGRPLPFASWPAGVFLALAVGTFLSKPLSTFSFPCFAVWTAILIARLLARREALTLRGPAFAHLRALGICSYSFYLFHQPLLSGLSESMQKLHASTPPAVLFLICLGAYPLLFALAWLCARQVERHSVAVGKLFLRPAPGRPG